MKINDEHDCKNQEVIVCPWCGYRYETVDAWRDGDNGYSEKTCRKCEKDFSWRKEYEVTISSKRPKCSKYCEYVDSSYAFEKCKNCFDKRLKGTG